MMNKIVMFICLIGMGWHSVVAQQIEGIQKTDPFNVRQKKALSIMPTYQSWTEKDGNSITQVNNTLQFYYQAGTQLSLMVRNSQASTQIKAPASTSSYAWADLAGITDSQILMGYRLKDKPIMFNVALNIPTGKTALTRDELASSILISSQVLELSVPHYGQGVGALLGVSAAFPVSESFVLGGGASYQYNGKYKPLADLETTYKPGAEIAADIGFNVLLSPQAMISTDVIYTNYSADSFGDQTVFQIGNKLTANVQFRQKMGENEFALMARYRTRSKNSVPVFVGQAYELQPSTENTNPSFFALLGQYQWKINPKLTTSFTGEFKKFKKAEALFSGASLVGIGVQPEFMVNEQLSIPLFLKFTSGNYLNAASTKKILSNLNAGLGVYWSF
jgi:hypothetical protein